MTAKVILEVTHGSMKGKCFEYHSHNVFLLGRRSHCHATIDDDYVSRHQFLLEACPPSVRLTDLDSTHGTFVNDRKYGGRVPANATPGDPTRGPASVDLSDGDRIRVGKTELLVRIIESAASAPVDAEAASAGATLQVPELNLAPTAPRDQPDRKPNSTELPTILRCAECGQDLYKTDTDQATDADLSSETICPGCRGTAAVGIKRLVHLARNVWKKLAVGNDWEGYRIESEIGRGSFGIVCRARRISDGRIVAIKSMLSKVAVSDQSRRVFNREIEIMRQLRHPNLVAFIEKNTPTVNSFLSWSFATVVAWRN